MRRPNILLIYTDQQRKDSLGCYGNQNAITPNIDKLSKEGARLEQYYVQCPVCMASRMSFLTGKYCNQIGIGSNGVPLPANTRTIVDLLKPYGYHCAQLGKLHFEPHAKRNHKDPATSYRFDTFILSDEPGCYEDAYLKWVETEYPEYLEAAKCALPEAAEKYYKTGTINLGRNTHEPYAVKDGEKFSHSRFVTEETKDFIKTHKNDPFFCISGFYAPHPPVNPPEKFVSMYEGKRFTPPVVGKNETTMECLEDKTLEEWNEIKKYYMALVSHVDDCVGDILKTLEEEQLVDNTLVIFTSDHGEFLGDHGRVQKGRPGHDCIINVPMILRYPGHIKSGNVIDGLIEGIDILPTILDYARIQTPSDLFGVSIVKALKGEVQPLRESVFMEYFDPKVNDRPAINHSTVRTEKFKYYISEYEEGLFDLEKDPEELENVIDQKEYQIILSQMRRIMITKLQQTALRQTNFEAEY